MPSSTISFQLVSHPSTVLVQFSLTSVSQWKLVYPIIGYTSSWQTAQKAFGSKVWEQEWMKKVTSTAALIVQCCNLNSEMLLFGWIWSYVQVWIAPDLECSRPQKSTCAYLLLFSYFNRALELPENEASRVPHCCKVRSARGLFVFHIFTTTLL